MQNYHFYQCARVSQQRIHNWLRIIGFFLALLGLLAIISSFTATKVTMLLFGGLLLLAGMAEGGHALLDRRAIFKSRLFSALLYSLVGLVLLFDPIGSAIGLTLLIALLLLGSGIMRLLVAYSLTRAGMAAGWHLMVGLLNILLSLLILLSWPETGNWLIGFVIGMELLFAGAITAFAFNGIQRP